MSIYVIDLFCGAGGTTTGINKCTFLRKQTVRVIACVNHDKNAILSHAANHPECVHFTEDIRTFDIIKKLLPLLEKIRKADPNAIFVLWASLECTNFSIAKGGKPRDADSRTLAEHLYRYIDLIQPHYIKIENVKEFMSWGPLDENGKPLSKKNGTDFMAWKQKICDGGYNYEHQLINAADLGAYTSRVRYFGMFARTGYPFAWPEQTHAKKPGAGLMFKGLRKWKAVKEVLDLHDKGQSIFSRKKELSDKTKVRIYEGLIKFVAGGKESFLLKYNSMNQKGQYASPDMDTTAPTIPCRNFLYLVHADQFISKNYSGAPASKNVSINGVAGALTCTAGNQSLVSTQFLSMYYSSGDCNNNSIETAANTIRTKDCAALLSASQYIMRDFKTNSNKPITVPAGSLLPVPKQHLVSADGFLIDQNFSNGASSLEKPARAVLACHKHQYIVNPAWGGNNGDVDKPLHTIVARQDKAPLSIVNIETGDVIILLHKDDSEITRLIKEFMVMYGIVDIKMRMLKINELLLIQGFPKQYILIGTQTDQKKFIGNSVHPLVPRKWFRALSRKLYDMDLLKLAA